MKRTASCTIARALLMTLASAFIILLSASDRAAAQPCCPTYTMIINPSVPAGCFPLSVTTHWGGGAVIYPTTYGGPGTYTETAPPPMGCWPQPLYKMYINGQTFFFNAAPPLCVTQAIACGTLTVCYTLDPFGCPVITIS